MTTIMVVEDDPVFLNRFCRIIASDPELALFAAVPDCASARQALAKSAPDVLLTDLGLTDGSGISIIRETSQRYPETDIMVVTVFGDEEHVLAAIEAQPPESDLSARESEVLSLIAKGFSFGEIARLLGVSPHTVTTHVKKIYQKLAVHSRGEAVYEAGKMGLI